MKINELIPIQDDYGIGLNKWNEFRLAAKKRGE